MADPGGGFHRRALLHPTYGALSEEKTKTLTSSFRDPAGCVFSTRDRIMRIVERSAIDDLAAFLRSNTAAELLKAGQIVSTNELSESDITSLIKTGDLPTRAQSSLVLEHGRVWFPSYPYEWPPEMLQAAASLTLDIAGKLLREGLGIKDATPYNILFEGPAPVFVDILSFERRKEGDAAWLAYAQFVRTFLLPLLAHRGTGLTCGEHLLCHRDGIEPELLYRCLGPIQRLLPPSLSLVSIPTWLSRFAKNPELRLYEKRLRDPEQARFILRCLFSSLRRTLTKVQPFHGRSSWLLYTATKTYSSVESEAKELFVSEAVRECRSRHVLDIGCNTGQFSRLVARLGARVVAIDSDTPSVGQLWRSATDEKLDILPLAVDIARPSPAVGWRNCEDPSFLSRARGAFDCVLMLAVVHHLVITERVPLAEIMRLAAELTTDLLIIELVLPQDPMFMSLTRGRAHLHVGFTRSAFESVCRERFEIARTEQIGGMDRWMYALRKRP